MARVLTDINVVRDPPFPFKKPEELRYCANGCGPIIPDKECYWESLVTGEWYCDKVCMVKAEGARWEGNLIRDDWNKLYTVEQWKVDREVIEHG